MYDAETRRQILTRIDAGESLRGIERETGISRPTLRDWRARGGAYASKHVCQCPRCQSRDLAVQAYLYVLGQYLGDGCIDRMGRTWVLRVATCDQYPAIRAELIAAIGQLVSNPVHLVQKEGCTTVGCITRQWLHLLPQHGPGRKHLRPIVLEQWQRDLVELDPRPLIRGLIHSDGCRITNWTEKSVGDTTKRYTYPRYFFTNVSEDILGIFAAALDMLGIAWKQNRWNSISVARREAVAALDEFVGPKS